MENFIVYLKKDIAKNLFDYLALLTGSIFFLIFLKLFQGERFISFVAVLTFVAFYIIWGTYHHISKKDLRTKNLIEYIIIGFTILLLLTVIFSF